MVEESVSITVQTVPSAEPQPKLVSGKKSSRASSKGRKAKRSKSRSVSPAKPKSGRESKKGSGRRKGSSRRHAKPIGLEGGVDILSPIAMYNLSYIAHEAQSALVFRGYAWKGGPLKKNKGKKKK